jgi:hypothetical protein
MDAFAIIAKICGVVLLGWTAHSIFKHFTHRSIITILCPGNPRYGTVPSVKAIPGEEKKHSMTERFLNGLLLYLWFIFLVAFSIGLITNN